MIHSRAEHSCRVAAIKPNSTTSLPIYWGVRLLKSGVHSSVLLPRAFKSLESEPWLKG